ncbi:hypothetical protein ACWGKQ_37650 [Streptomyces sp. NPDC054770]
MNSIRALVTVPRSGREISLLAGTMNTTLDRLQSSVEQQHQFTADRPHVVRAANDDTLHSTLPTSSAARPAAGDCRPTSP